MKNRQVFLIKLIVFHLHIELFLLFTSWNHWKTIHCSGYTCFTLIEAINTWLFASHSNSSSSNTKFTLEIFQWFSSGHNKIEWYANYHHFQTISLEAKLPLPKNQTSSDNISSEFILSNEMETNMRVSWITNFEKEKKKPMIEVSFWLVCTSPIQFHFSSEFNEKKKRQFPSDLSSKAMSQYYCSLKSTLVSNATVICLRIVRSNSFSFHSFFFSVSIVTNQYL